MIRVTLDTYIYVMHTQVWGGPEWWNTLNHLQTGGQAADRVTLDISPTETAVVVYGLCSSAQDKQIKDYEKRQTQPYCNKQPQGP